MENSIKQIIESYNPNGPLAEAWTIPAAWYVDSRIMELERRTVFCDHGSLLGAQIRSAIRVSTSHGSWPGSRSWSSGATIGFYAASSTSAATMPPPS